MKILSLFFLSLISCVYVFADNQTENKIPSVENIFLNRIEKLRNDLQELEKEVEASERVLLDLKKEVISTSRQPRLIISSAPELGSNYALVESEYYLDGKKIKVLTKENSQDVIYNQTVMPGKHDIKVEKIYRDENSVLGSAVTLRLKKSVSIKAVEGEVTEVGVISFSENLNKGKQKLAIRFSVKKMPASDADRISSLINEALNKTETKDITARLAIVLPSIEVPGLVLSASSVTVNEKPAITLDPTLVTYKGQVIYDSPVDLGSKKIKVAVSYKVSGQLAKLWKTTEIKLMFEEDFIAKAGYKTTFVLNGLRNQLGDNLKVVML